MAIEEVERRVTDWLRQRHLLPQPFSETLRQCLARQSALPAQLQADIDEALSELERIQSGL